MSVRLHIERLVLEGLALNGAEAGRVRAAVEAELAERLAGEAPDSWANLSVPLLTFAPTALPSGPGPEPLGRAIGAALHAGLRR